MGSWGTDEAEAVAEAGGSRRRRAAIAPSLRAADEAEAEAATAAAAESALNGSFWEGRRLFRLGHAPSATAAARSFLARTLTVFLFLFPGPEKEDRRMGGGGRGRAAGSVGQGGKGRVEVREGVSDPRYIQYRRIQLNLWQQSPAPSTTCACPCGTELRPPQAVVDRRSPAWCLAQTPASHHGYVPESECVSACE